MRAIWPLCAVLALTPVGCADQASDAKRPVAEVRPPESESDPKPPAPRRSGFLCYAVSSIEGDRLNQLATAFCEERGAKYSDARVFYSDQLGDLPRELGMRDFRTETPPLEPSITTNDEKERIYFLLECEPATTK